MIKVINVHGSDFTVIAIVLLSEYVHCREFRVHGQPLAVAPSFVAHLGSKSQLIFRLRWQAVANCHESALLAKLQYPLKFVGR